MKRADKLGFEVFVQAHADGLMRTAYLLTGNLHDAEDLLASTLERVAQRWGRVSAHERPDLYARRVLANLATDRWRALARRPTRALTAFDEPGLVADHAAATVRRDLVIRLLRELPRRQRAIVVLRHYHDMSEIEVADVLRCSVGTVKSQLSRGLRRLRELAAASDLADTNDLLR